MECDSKQQQPPQQRPAQRQLEPQSKQSKKMEMLKRFGRLEQQRIGQGGGRAGGAARSAEHIVHETARIARMPHKCRRA